MQHSSFQRTLRFLGFSIGFVLFVVMLFYAAQSANDPRAVRGRPSLFGPTTVLSQLTDAQSTAATSVSMLTLTAATQHAAHSSGTTDKGDKPAAKKGVASEAASMHVYTNNGHAVGQPPVLPQLLKNPAAVNSKT